MRRHRIRYVQVARSGPFESDGITVLDDSRQPQRVFLQGAYKLSDELRRNGTVPQFGGVHRCALKFKAWVIEQWLEEHLRGPARHAFGYNADESGRIAKSEYATSERIAFGFNADETERIERSREYNTATRQAFYPLQDWGWSRKACTDFLFSVFGIAWKRSACVYCPFNALGPEGLQRHRLHPEQVGDAMAMEHVSLALNPRATLYKKHSLIEIATATGNEEAVTRYHHRIDSGRWAIYRVRRIYSAKGRADRAVENIASFGIRSLPSSLYKSLPRNWDSPSSDCATSLTSGGNVEARLHFPRARTSSLRRQRRSTTRRDMASPGSNRSGPHFNCAFSKKARHS